MALVALQPGQLAYAGYLFNASWFLSDIGYEVTMEPVDIPFAPGQYNAPGKPGPKAFTIGGADGGNGSILDSNGNPITTLDQAQAEVDRLMPLAYMGDQPLQWRVDRWVYAQMQKPKITYMTGNGYRCPVIALDFLATDPRSFSYAAHSTPIQSGASGGATSATLANAGSWRSYPKITFTFQSTCKNPQVLVAPPSGGGHIILELLGTFATTDTVVVDCNPRSRSIKQNGNANLGIFALPIVNTTYLPSEVLPFLDALGNGQSTMTVSANGGSGTGQFTATVAWNDVWI